MSVQPDDGPARPGRHERPVRIRVEAATPPDPARLRGALRARLAGRPWPAGVEADVAEQVHAALSRARTGGASWR